MLLTNCHLKKISCIFVYLSLSFLSYNSKNLQIQQKKMGCNQSSSYAPQQVFTIPNQNGIMHKEPPVPSVIASAPLQKKQEAKGKIETIKMQSVIPQSSNPKEVLDPKAKQKVAQASLKKEEKGNQNLKGGQVQTQKQSANSMHEFLSGKTIKPITTQDIAAESDDDPTEVVSDGQQEGLVAQIDPQLQQSSILSKLNAKQKTIFDAAEQLYDNQDYSAARNQYKKLKVSHQYLLSKIGLTFLYQQNYSAALQWFNKSVQSNSQCITSQFQLAVTHNYLNNYDAAISILQKCEKLGKKRPEVLREIGQNYYDKDDYQKAKLFLKHSLQLSGDKLQTLKILALTYYYNQQYPQAVSVYQKILLLKPNKAKIISEIGNCYYMADDYDQAIVWQQKAIDIQPKQQKYYFRMGQNYYYKSEYPKAREWYLKGNKINPKNEKILSEIGMCFYYQQKNQEAIEWFQRALKINDHNFLTFHRIGIAYFYNQEQRKGISWHKKAIKINPKCWSAHIGVANCYYYLQEYEQCIKYFKSAIEVNDKQPFGHFMCGKAYYEWDHSLEAVPYLEKTIQLAPDNPIHYLYYGKALLQIQNFAESYRQFKKAQQMFQDTQLFEQQEKNFLIDEISQFKKNAVQWEQKRRIGYISPADKEQIKKMKNSFQKKFKSVFGVSSGDKRKTSRKPLNNELVEICKLIAADQFRLDISKQDSSEMAQMAVLIRKMFEYDQGTFQIFAYIFEEYVWQGKYEKKKTYGAIESELAKVIRFLSAKYPPTVKGGASIQQPVAFPEFKEIKLNLFIQSQFFSSYDVMVKEIQRVNKLAKQDLEPFRELVYRVEKECGGCHAKVGMKLPDRPKQVEAQEDYQQKLFKVLIRIFEKMFKELAARKESIIAEIQRRLSVKKIPLYEVVLVIMNTWIQNINSILIEREKDKVPTLCCVSDLVRGKCMFESVAGLQVAAQGVIKLCEEKQYRIMQLDNRLMKQTQDIVFKIQIKNVVSQLQLALIFDTVTFDFGHSFYQIERCPLGCIFGSTLFLTKDVSQSFLQQVYDSIEIIKKSKAVNEDAIKSLKFIHQTFKKSAK